MIKEFFQLNPYLHFSKLGFFFFSFISTGAVVLSYRDSITLAEIPKGFLLGALATLLVYPVFIGASWLVNKFNIFDTLGIKFVFLITLGLIRGLCVHFGAELLSLEHPTTLESRLVNSAFTTLVWLGLFSTLVEANYRYKRKYQALISQLLISNIDPSKGPDVSFALAASELTNFQVSLSRTHAQALDNVSLRLGANQASAQIFAQVESILKPLSHKIWARSLISVPKFDPSALLKLSIIDFRAQPKLVFPIFWLTSSINYSVAFGATTGIVRSTIGTFLLVIFELMRQTLIKISRDRMIWINSLYLIFVGFLIVYFSTILTSQTSINSALPFLLALGPYVTLILIVFSILTHAMSGRAKILNRLMAEISAREVHWTGIQARTDPSDFQFASYLHNSLQSELVAIAFELREAALDPFPGRVERALERLSVVSRRSLRSDFADYLEGPYERFTKIIDSWNSIVEIELDIEGEIFVDEIRASVFVQLVQEAIANSVRRGEAKMIAIRAFYDMGVFKVEITDNGTSRTQTGTGLGQTWIDRLAISDWSFNQTSGKSTLSVEF